MDNNCVDIKSLILDRREPIVLKNILNWNILKWTLDDWQSVLDQEKLEFRVGVNYPTEEPQWERKTKLFEGDFTYFINHAQNNMKEWLYFDYKDLHTWFANIESLKREINWSPIGFPEIQPEDSTIWIGSKGAHTSCHMDCYGFNLVHQIYGKKLWLLFPPEENLKPTRIPYEESSIYSKLNFFSPKPEQFEAVTKCRKIVLNPGDVLFVPHKWWHYVENLETSISINTWLPLVEDSEERLKESIVQYFVKQVTEISPSEINSTILNPNMDEVILPGNQVSCVDILNKCKKICRESTAKRLCTDSSKKNPEEAASKIDEFITTIPILSREEFLTFINQQIDRFDGYTYDKEVLVNSNDDKIELLEALTNPNVIDMITNILLKNKR